MALNAVRLGIDFGSTHTVAYLGLPDGRVEPLLFDSSPLLSSAVCADRDGRLLTGQDADRGGRQDPGRAEPNPKLRIDDGQILLGDREYPVVELVSAVLTRVAAEAVRVAGVPPHQVVLTHPAYWAGHRRAVLVAAAEKAGLGTGVLVPEPLAAAAYFRAVGSVAPDAALAVYDLGGGTFDASFVRPDPDGGWTVAASDGLDEVGGLDLDAALFDHIGRTVGAREPRRWQRLVNPTTDDERRRLLAFRVDVRAAKEQLSRTASTTVHVPVVNADAFLTRAEFEELARPWIDRTVERLARLIERAGHRPDVLCLVGGSSRIPLVATVLHRRLGIAPTVTDQPELAVAQGALAVDRQDVTDESPHVVESPLPPAPSLLPAYPTGRPARRRGLRTPVVAAVLAVVVLLTAGAVAWERYRDTNRSGGTPTGGGSRSDGATTRANPGVTAGKGARRQSVPINRTVWHAGLTAAFGTARYDADQRYQLTIDVKITNVSTLPTGAHLPATFTVAGKPWPGSVQDGPRLVSDSSVLTVLEFSVDDPVDDLRDGVLTIAENNKLPVVVPFNAVDTAVTLEPRTVLDNGALARGGMQFSAVRCELRGDLLDDFEQVDKGMLGIGCHFDVTLVDNRGDDLIEPTNIKLRLPDGTVLAPTKMRGEIVRTQSPVRNMVATFAVRWPAPGRYVLVLADLGRYDEKPPNAQNVGELPFDVPAA